MNEEGMSQTKKPNAVGRRPSAIPYKFERLEVWQMALSYNDLIYSLAGQLPKQEEFNLKSQIVRAGTSIALNIAEGSTSQSDPEQNRFLGMALRSLVETVACLRLIERRGYPLDSQLVEEIDAAGGKLFAKLQSFRNTIYPRQVREITGEYELVEPEPSTTD
jgi:four helix bundle protein